MISQNISSSPFNPLIGIHADIRLHVNNHFVKPIVENFFLDLGGLEKFDELEISKLTTDVEYKRDLNYINNYLYKEIMNVIYRGEDGSVIFKPKYCISFDKDLANCGVESAAIYPYKKIFNDSEILEPKIQYGSIKLGDETVLYIIYIDFQQLIRYIKQRSNDENTIIVESPKRIETDIDKRNRLLGKAIENSLVNLKRTVDSEEKISYDLEIDRLTALIDQPLKGSSGKIRINLSWNTTDDLDLFVSTPNGIINYANKVITNNDIIAELDLDCNSGQDVTNLAQENIIWDGIPKGEHTVGVNFFRSREKTNVEFTLTILLEEGEGRIYNSFVNIEHFKDRIVTRFEFIDGLIQFKD